MQPLERTNIAAAVLAVAIIAALFTPPADPARLSVADQMRRLERGAVTADTFDYAFLRFDGGRAGERALVRLSRSSDPDVARRAADVLKAEDRHSPGVRAPRVERRPVVEVLPGSALPPGFLESVSEPDPRTACARTGDCVARVADLDGDGRAEVMLAAGGGLNLFRQTPGGWSHVGAWPINTCGAPADPRALLRDGAVRPVAPEWPELEIDGRRSTLFADRPCPPKSPPR
jgi:hypothetical protein